MTELSIYVADSSFAELNVLRENITSQGLSRVDELTQAENIFAIGVVDKDPWQQATVLKTDNVVYALVYYTSEIDPAPDKPLENVSVLPWSNIQDASQVIQKLHSEILAVMASTSTEESEPELIEEDAIMDATDIVRDVESNISPSSIQEDPAPTAAPPQLRSSSNKVSFEDISKEDSEFIRRVFNQVRDVDFRSPPPPPPSKSLSGIDKKVHFLREKVRELERDLARIGYVWRTKQKQVDMVEQLLSAKESERTSASQRYQQMKDQATKAAANHQSQSKEFKSHIQTLEKIKNQLEVELDDYKERLSREEKEKALVIADFRQKIETAQATFNQLRDQSVQNIKDLENRINATKDALKAKHEELEQANQIISEREQTISDRDQTINNQEQNIQSLSDTIASHEENIKTLHEQMDKRRDEFEQRLNQAQKEKADLEHQLEQANLTIEARNQSISSLENEFDAARQQSEVDLANLQHKFEQEQDSKSKIVERLSEREKTLATLTDEMANHRKNYEVRIEELKSEINGHKQVQDELTKEITSARAEFKQIGEQYEENKSNYEELSKEHGALSETLETERHQWAEKEQTFIDSQETSKNEQHEIQERVSKLEIELSEKEGIIAETQTTLINAQEECRLAQKDAENLGEELRALQEQTPNE